MLELKMALSWSYRGRRGTETLFHTAIGSFLTSLRDWAPAFRVMVSEVLEPSVDEQYATDGHGKWAPLAAATAKGKGSDTILFTSGRLAGSFKRGGQDNVEIITRQSLSWGSRVPYAIFHQTGTGAGFQALTKAVGERGVPMRKLLALTSQQKAAMRSIMVVRLANIARAEGFAMVPGIKDPGQARNLGKELLGL